MGGWVSECVSGWVSECVRATVTHHKKLCLALTGTWPVLCGCVGRCTMP